MTPQQLAHIIANTSNYPTTSSEVQISVEEWKRLGYEVRFSKPVDVTPEVKLRARPVTIFLCENCATKIGGDGKCHCGQHFPNEFCY